MPTQISIVSTKGGVGKTTRNLGALLADLGKRVFLVNADIQPTLSSYYRLANRAPRGLVDVLETGDLTRWDQRSHRRMRHLPLERSPGSFPTRSCLTPMAGSV